ncbi:MAG: hypothetical protein AB7K04_18080 [Pseudorhodoplanes sp.]
MLLLGLAAAHAQTLLPTDAPTDLNEGKTPAQLFQGDCSVCHAKPQGLAKDRNPRSLVGFLRQHYTSSVQSADAIAGYLLSAGPGTPPPVASGRRGRDQMTPGADRPALSPASRRAAPEGADGPAHPQRRRGGEASAPSGSEPRPPRRVPDHAGPRPEQPAGARRPAAEPPKPATASVPEPKVETKPEARPEPKPESKPEAAPAVRPDAIPD